MTIETALCNRGVFKTSLQTFRSLLPSCPHMLKTVLYFPNLVYCVVITISNLWLGNSFALKYFVLKDTRPTKYLVRVGISYVVTGCAYFQLPPFFFIAHSSPFPRICFRFHAAGFVYFWTWHLGELNEYIVISLHVHTMKL